MQGTKKILIFGSGLMSQSVIVHLLKRPQNNVHIASDIPEDAKKIAELNDPKRCTYSKIDVKSQKDVTEVVKNCDIAISYVPAFLHIYIAKVCLQQGKNLVTASYVSPEMKELDEKVKEKGLTFLNELGLDPGIDHLATMKIVHDTQKNGGKILEYQSWCGGLPSPQFCDNPLGYKFTWSPIGALRALKNQAVFIQDSNQITVQGHQLQYHAKVLQINQALTLEGYPNRNSVNYKQIYGLKDANKVLRGTLRYKGFCTVVNAWKQLGLLQETQVKASTWVQLLNEILKDSQGANLQQKLRSRSINKVKHYENVSQEQRNKKFAHIIKTFKYFNMLNQNTKIWNKEKNTLQNLVNLLQQKISLKEGETDMIAMQHIFTIEKQGKKKILKSSLIQIGQKNGFSAMAKTVGTPTAIGAQLLLDGKISEKGVIIPKYPDIYEPVLQELEKCGVKLFETEQEL